MPSAHETFKALGPVDWETLHQEDLMTLMTDIFRSAHCLIDSIPTPSEDEPRSPSEEARELRKEWKEVKINARENPLGLNVYKQAAKDGKGGWFARRSVHDGLSFRKWKTGMEREFSESLKVQGQPGDGKIRGLGADKCVANQTVDGCGKIQVYQLSAQFPGPTTPRDFVTLCLSSDTTTTPAPNGTGEPRSFMLVSKPCVHPECPVRQGFIRGYYESVEFIREIKIDKTLPSTRLSEDVTSEDPSAAAAEGSDNVGEESVVSTTLKNGKEDGLDSAEHEDQDGDSIIEWMMITRSDPGGSVPRFIIEKKTPEGIANDATKFLKWISSVKFEQLLRSSSKFTPAETDAAPGVALISKSPHASPDSISKPTKNLHVTSGPEIAEPNSPESPGPGGVYGMISGALGMVASAAASRLLGTTEESESEPEISEPDISDCSSSIHSFHSFDAADAAAPATITADGKEPPPALPDSAKSSSEFPPSAESTSTHSSRHDKELKKLEDQRQKAQEKIRRAEARALAKKHDDAQRDELAQQKLRAKHERELAKQEERYQRDRAKLEAKRASEERKAEARRRKVAEREQRADLALELDLTRAQRDVAREQVAILAAQVGELQALNTRLVARLGREGRDDHF
ncbi:hypothetical protein F4825DRAFT_463551 [Nemania diffusa]|nr:hypothetical protein F4825DRAFT_463551 [Nemania diffusa]